MFFKYNKNSATKRILRNFVVFAVVMLFTTVFLSLFPEQVYAARKTKTLVITDLYPGSSIRPHYINDYTKFDIADTTINYGNSGTLTLPSGWGSIKVTFSGSTATVTLTNVDVYKKTPYLEINAGNRTGYKASGWKTVTDSGNAGLDETIHPNPPQPNKWTDNTCDFYMGAKFTADKMQVLWASNQYNLTLDYNGATTIPSSTTVYNNYLTYDGKIANIYDASKIAKTGYTFGGWYCGDVKLWNADGTPVKGAKVNGSAWSDSNGNYKWAGNTGVKAKWIPITVNVTYHKNDGGSSTASQTFTYGVTKQQFGKKTDGSPLWGTEKEDGFGGWDRPGYRILIPEDIECYSVTAKRATSLSACK